MTTPQDDEPVSFGRRLTELATERPDDADLTIVAGDGTERAEVRVRVTERWGGPFATDESTFTEIIVLTNDSDGWHIAEPPWPYSDCGPWPTVEAER